MPYKKKLKQIKKPKNIKTRRSKRKPSKPKQRKPISASKVKTKIRKISKIGKRGKKASRIVEKKLKSNSKKLAKKIVKKAIQKVNAKKLIKSSTIKKTYKEIMTTDVETATIPYLKRYIKLATKLVNKARPTMNRASVRAFNKAIEQFGMDEAGGISDVISGMKKIDLKEKAEILQSIIEGDGVSAVAKIIKDIATEKAYKTFNNEVYKSYKEGPSGMLIGKLSKDDYVELVTEAGRVQEVIGDYYNEGDFDLMYTLGIYGKKYGYRNVGDLVIKTFIKGRGLRDKQGNKLITTAEQMDDLIMDTIRKATND